MGKGRGNRSALPALCFLLRQHMPLQIQQEVWGRAISGKGREGGGASHLQSTRSLKVRPHHTHAMLHSTCYACRSESGQLQAPSHRGTQWPSGISQQLSWTETAVAAALVRASAPGQGQWCWRGCEQGMTKGGGACLLLTQWQLPAGRA